MEDKAAQKPADEMQQSDRDLVPYCLNCRHYPRRGNYCREYGHYTRDLSQRDCFQGTADYLKNIASRQS